MQHPLCLDESTPKSEQNGGPNSAGDVSKPLQAYQDRVDKKENLPPPDVPPIDLVEDSSKQKRQQDEAEQQQPLATKQQSDIFEKKPAVSDQKHSSQLNKDSSNSLMARFLAAKTNKQLNQTKNYFAPKPASTTVQLLDVFAPGLNRRNNSLDVAATWADDPLFRKVKLYLLLFVSTYQPTKRKMRKCGNFRQFLNQIALLSDIIIPNV